MKIYTPLRSMTSLAAIALLASSVSAQTSAIGTTVSAESAISNVTIRTADNRANRGNSNIGATVQNVAVQPNSSAAVSSNPVANNIRDQLFNAGNRLIVNGIEIGSLDKVRSFYANRDYQPVWLSGDKPNRLASELDQLLVRAINHGLNPFDYGFKDISQSIRSLRIAFASTDRQLSDFDILLTSAFIQFGEDLTTGKTNPKKWFETWTLDSRSANTVGILNTAVANGNLNEAIQRLSPPYYQYNNSVHAISELRRISAAGGWPTVKAWGSIEPNQTDGRIPTIRQILYIMGDYQPSSQAAMESTVYDSDLINAVKSFQERHGLGVDGVIGDGTFAELNVPVEARISRLELNMERWRWLPESLGSRYVFVNIPDYRVKVIEGNNTVLDSKIVVGRRDRETPVFSDTMEYTVMNPYWYVPRSIAVKDKLPQLKQDPYALAKAGIRVFSGGEEVDPGNYNWANYNENNFPFQLRQDPGDINALGSIKFIFPNKHAIYLHDTPSRSLFDKTIRSYSSGCIRVEKYLDFAEYLLPQWSRDKIVENTSGGSEKRVNLETTLPVHLLYFTAWTDDQGRPHFRPDIYDKDNPLANDLGI